MQPVRHTIKRPRRGKYPTRKFGRHRKRRDLIMYSDERLSHNAPEVRSISEQKKSDFFASLFRCISIQRRGSASLSHSLTHSLFFLTCFAPLHQRFVPAQGESQRILVAKGRFSAPSFRSCSLKFSSRRPSGIMPRIPNTSDSGRARTSPVDARATRRTSESSTRGTGRA